MLASAVLSTDAGLVGLAADESIANIGRDFLPTYPPDLFAIDTDSSGPEIALTLICTSEIVRYSDADTSRQAATLVRLIRHTGAAGICRYSGAGCDVTIGRPASVSRIFVMHAARLDSTADTDAKSLWRPIAVRMQGW
jgi:hypothetical protein